MGDDGALVEGLAIVVQLQAQRSAVDPAARVDLLDGQVQPLAVAEPAWRCHGQAAATTTSPVAARLPGALLGRRAPAAASDSALRPARQATGGQSLGTATRSRPDMSLLLKRPQTIWRRASSAKVPFSLISSA